MTNTPIPNRLHVVDALRGFAIVSIMLLHNLEHFDFYFRPKGLPEWMVHLDQGIWDSLFFMFAGKSYAIFALLFGLTFYIQSSNQRKKGRDFRGRFAWRLILLFGFGMVNSIFYQGDILTLYAVVGFLLIPVSILNNKSVLIIAVLLLAQPVTLFKFVYACQHPELEFVSPLSWKYFGHMKTYLSADDFWPAIWGNLTNGKSAVVLWNWENGRYFHMLALFSLGLLMGRKQLFVSNASNTRFWVKTLITSILLFIVLYSIQRVATGHLETKVIRRAFVTVEKSWTNISFMFVLLSVFYLVFQSRVGGKVLSIFSPIGKMSLSNYLMQSILGAFIYHGYGLGLYQYTGATYSLLIGIGLAVGMGIFSHWWASRFRHGPLEYLWHQATWVSRKDLR